MEVGRRKESARTTFVGYSTWELRNSFAPDLVHTKTGPKGRTLSHINLQVLVHFAWGNECCYYHIPREYELNLILSCLFLKPGSHLWSKRKRKDVCTERFVKQTQTQGCSHWKIREASANADARKGNFFSRIFPGVSFWIQGSILTVPAHWPQASKNTNGPLVSQWLARVASENYQWKYLSTCTPGLEKSEYKEFFFFI